LKTKARIACSWFVIGCFVCVFFLNATLGAEVVRMAVLPFKMNADKDVSYLREGIWDMLASRLSRDGKMVIIDRPETDAALEAVAGAGAITEAVSREIGAKLKADYVLYGSLTAFGNSVSLDAKLLDLAEGKPPVAFFAQSPDSSNILLKIDEMASDINQKAFGRTSVARQVSATKPQQPSSPDIYVHPEKLLEQVDGMGAVREGNSDGPIGAYREEPTRLQSFWKSPNFRLLFNGLAVGDVDRDGKMETVVITPHSLLIFRSDQGRFVKVQEIAESRKIEYIGVDIADINGNGYAEIFLTALNAFKNGLQSKVLEYNGQAFTNVVEDSPWFYRVVDLPMRGRILLGQKLSAGDPFRESIFEMAWQNSAYVPGDRVNSFEKVNVMGAALADVLNNQQETALAYNSADNLVLFEPSSGKEIWKGSDRYGGSDLFVAGPKMDQGDIFNPRFLPMRILAKDLNQAGTVEIIAVKNEEITDLKMERFRKFTDAHVEGLVWDGLGLASNWRTRRISGFIRDYAIADFDNDGQDELVAAVVVKTGSTVFSDAESTVIAYDIGSQRR
jgi:TolB-like protein